MCLPKQTLLMLCSLGRGNDTELMEAPWQASLHVLLPALESPNLREHRITVSCMAFWEAVRTSSMLRKYPGSSKPLPLPWSPFDGTGTSFHFSEHSALRGPLPRPQGGSQEAGNVVFLGIAYTLVSFCGNIMELCPSPSCTLLCVCVKLE